MGVLLLWQQYASARFQTNLGWVLWLFFIGITALIHIILMKASDNSPKSLITWFMAITGIKLFTYLTIILIYGVLKGEKALGFVMLFLVFYFLYSAFEVVTLLRSFKKTN
jgi:hypothetical protein